MCANDSAARQLQALITAHAALLRGRVRTMLGDADAADDVLQETWLRAWRHFCVGRAPIHSPAAWLWRLARTAALDFLRREGSRTRCARTAATEAPAPDDCALSDADRRMRAIAKQRIADAAYDAVVRLPERERYMAVMYFDFDFPARVIAERCGTSARYVSTALCRIKRKLQSQARAVAAAADDVSDIDLFAPTIAERNRAQVREGG